MKPAKILERLEKAKQLIAIPPEDADILGVQIDGLNVYNVEKLNSIHLNTPFRRLVEDNVIGDNSWATEDDPGQDFIVDSILIGGFYLFNLRDREKAPLSDANTEGGARRRRAPQLTLLL